ncbi:MAG TPA: alkaline phosphatase family protein [candidate division Zixibacteria bacterium]|nr:alkaline phosphatase family protein [candidate division Zixibacteria bacterium]
MNLPLRLLVSAVWFSSAAVVFASADRSPPKAIVVAWDGAVPAFAGDLLRQGKLPHLSRLIETGVFADDVLAVYPSLTAPGFASLMTGARPDATGITGNRIPRLPKDRFTVLESAPGFSPELQRAETIVEVARRAGRNVVDLHMPFAPPRSGGGLHFRGYAGISGRDGVVDAESHRPRASPPWTNAPASLAAPLETSFAVGASTLYCLLIDDPADERPGYDTMLVAPERDAARAKARLKAAPAGAGPSYWSDPVQVRTASGEPATVYFRLFHLDPGGKEFLLYFTRPARDLAAPPHLLRDASPLVRAFVGNGASVPYLRRNFGPTIPDGGDGLAEARYLETVSFALYQLEQAARWAIAFVPWDLFFVYTPFPDESEHLWRGYLDPALPGYRSEIAGRLRPLLERIYRGADELLGVLMAHRPDDTLVALISDHGMEATDRLVSVNKAFQRAGLLAVDETGRVDLAKTKLLCPPGTDGYLLFNMRDRRQGSVGDRERAALVEKARQALAEIRDGARRVVANVYDARARGSALGIGGDAGGDLYVDLVPGYELDCRLGGAGELIVKREPHGAHGFDPARPSMRTILALSGPGVHAGRRLSGVRVIDFAPTLARLLRLPPPKDATGRILREALIEP